MDRSLSTTDGWVGLELRHLTALVSVAREGSFGRAASYLGYTQSAISQQIAALERIIGEKLIERPEGPRTASLTETGEILLRHAQAIVARLDAAHADITALRAGESGRLRIGTYQSISARLLPVVMRGFRAEWPKVELLLSEPDTDAELYHLIESGELDLAFCSLPVPDGPFTALELLQDPYILLVPTDHPAASRSSATLDDLDDTPIIGCAATGEKLQDAVRASGYELAYAFRSDNNATLQALVASGFGIALVPQLAVAPTGDEGVRVIRLEPPVPPRRLAVAWHRDRHHSPAARAFIEAARAASADLERVLAAETTTAPIGR